MTDETPRERAERTMADHQHFPIECNECALARDVIALEKELSEMASPHALANALDKVRLADQELDRAVRAAKVLIEAQGQAVKRAEKAEAENQRLRETVTPLLVEAAEMIEDLLQSTVATEDPAQGICKRLVARLRKAAEEMK